ncbi:MAG: hypothetical protein LBJ25_06995 [Candidatus Margulisbacteria bacterium]|jgi:hypothetical protein|nr:hypothetical protein [Candidatus Margulisiibacteriota bacterium]
MRKLWSVFLVAILCAGVFAQGSPAEVVGIWKHNKEGLAFQFNADGTFAMLESGEEARKAIEAEQQARGEAVITSVGGTYTLGQGLFGAPRVNMALEVDGQAHKIGMSYKKIDADTLQLDGQNYLRVK